MPTCRHCRRPVRLVECDGRWEWVHLAGGYPCRDAETWMALDTMAAPVMTGMAAQTPA